MCSQPSHNSTNQALTNYKSCENYESTCDLPYNGICPFVTRTCVARVLDLINYTFSPYLQLSNGKWLSLQQETSPYVSDFPLGYCDHSTLMERDPKSVWPVRSNAKEHTLYKLHHKFMEEHHQTDNSSGEGFETSFCQLSHVEKKLIERCLKSLSSFTSSCPHGMEVMLALQRTTNPPLKSENSCVIALHVNLLYSVTMRTCTYYIHHFN